MIDKLKKYIKKHDKLKNFILRKRSDLWSLSHLQIVSKLKKCHLDNLKLLSFDIPYLITCESHRTNDYYGQAATLKRYCGIDNKNSLKCVITHGADLFDHITDCDADSKLPGIITMSKGARKEIYTRANNKKHWAIGPYISYAESFLSEDKLKQEHERLGKNILFFPNHSTHHFTVNFNVEAVCKTIKQLAGNYDRIRVCLYWKDVQLGYYKTYQNFGFECVSAGHIYDNNFLRRLKSIIELSDVTVSNSVGTSLGYSIYMNKPHYLIKQKYDYEADHIAKENIEKQKLLENKLEMFYDIFGEFKETISLEQYEIVDRYWGTSCIKTKDGLKKIFDECERIYSHKEK